MNSRCPLSKSCGTNDVKTHLQPLQKSRPDLLMAEKGPAKGYIEALEIRLKETERMLWRILSACQQESLTAAFSPGVQDRIPQILSVGTLSTTEEKKSAIAFWEQFPLHTIEDVLVWKDQVENPSSMEITGFGENQDQQSQPTDTPSEVQDQDIPSAMDEDTAQTSIAMAPDSQDLADTSSRTVQMADARNRRSSASVANPGTAGGKFSFSKEFQDTFLW
ncbi:uncharacterized protein Z520_02144 [Fonsecaea multimorphosa CBS 102226]|uniref:Uncharacterized protein n=1 Tax=Fonsecaea multimorphosa CBS 102226 TaxID=1442371 RepID=A0A0D2HJE0_9EURO|nr:uncharacterized protein Z520_02144 [Fonsecaea multimorphosa CBS 102226]KIY02006.1 hypothetical protein Z520_02144 [Fonsecaea multimorphosa CBS 102226]OAL29687.1 hypothetical protein AYO22_02101 [Fonsecaea multimorphosa]